MVFLAILAEAVSQDSAEPPDLVDNPGLAVHLATQVLVDSLVHLADLVCPATVEGPA